MSLKKDNGYLIKPTPIYLGYGFLNADKMQILTATEGQYIWKKLEDFGLEKVPVKIEGLYRSRRKLVGYRFYFAGNCPIVSLYKMDYTIKENKTDIQNLNPNLIEQPILVYNNALSPIEESLRKVFSNRYMGKQIRDEIEIAPFEEIRNFELSNYEKLTEIYNCYNKTKNDLANQIPNQRQLYIKPAIGKRQ